MEKLTLALTNTQFTPMPVRQNITRPKAVFLTLIVCSFLSVISISLIDSAIHSRYSGIEKIELEEEQTQKWKYQHTQSTLTKIFKYTFKRLV